MRHKKTQLISLSAYCPQAKIRLWDDNDIRHRQVEIEDILNHPYVPMEIPKDMKYPKSLKMEDGPLHAFYKSIYSFFP